MKQQSIRLGTEKIPKLLLNLSMPAFIGMFVHSLYNVMDAVFIARGVGTIGVAALSIAFPIQMIIGGVAATFGIGGASIISRRLGAKRVEEANQVFGHIIWLLLFFSALLMISALLFLEPMLKAFGATETILPFAADYLGIILMGSMFLSFAMGTNNVVRSEGNAKIAMYTMIVSAGMNMLLNPLFIFGLNMGIKGAALATIISQSLAALWLLKYFLSGKSSLSLNWIWLPQFGTVKKIIQIGLPTFINMSASSLMFITVNWVLVVYSGEIQIAIFGILNRLITFSSMPILGIVQGMQPIIGFNYGAGAMARVKRTFQLCVFVATAVAVTTWAIFMAFPSFFLGIFSTDPAVVTNGVNALRLSFLAVPVIGLSIVVGGMYQALGKAKKAFILSMSRPILFLIPLVLILPQFLDVTGVWLAFALADGLSFLLAGILFFRERQTLFTHEPEESAEKHEAVQAR
ncbi:putative efflux protein, MATE family [Evansella caseinilytica]|uniref:Multidrug export protein MepA n=1 Tax=Evansella caseinilytica TaxID=1503961 RepID=A0A1H3SVA1_9BACI|nr:MATE family efflux transporter [Evansella caseinilytica]SDZ41455.1 putative efflux protein, MATE family [Evansella caseinilytica]